MIKKTNQITANLRSSLDTVLGAVLFLVSDKLGGTYIKDLSKERARWIARIIIAVSAVLVTLWFLGPLPDEVPMGDAYIHFVYARNLIQTGDLVFNPGLTEGIGTTSVLWVLLLAGLAFIGTSPVIGAKILGVFFLALAGVLVFEIASWVLERTGRRQVLPALAAGLLTVLPGNMVWIALSGMETILFLTLALMSVVLFVSGRWAWSGVALGLLALTRIEGLLLMGAILGVESIRRSPRFLPLLRLAGPAVLMVAPWILYLAWREGSLLPASFQGKQLAISEAAAVIESSRGLAGWFVELAPVFYSVLWLGLLFFYSSGWVEFPGPKYVIEGPISTAQFSIPLLAFFLAAVSLIGSAIFVYRSRDAGLAFLNRGSGLSRLVMILGLWLLAHNTAYALLIGNPGAAGRYSPMNILLFWTFPLIVALMVPRSWIRHLILAALPLFVGFGLIHWKNVYRANIEYMQQVRIPAAQYVDAGIPADAEVAAVDIGPLRYYARQPTIDLFGFVNKDIIELSEDSRDVGRYLLDRDIQYLLIFGQLENSENSWLSYTDQMGLADHRLVSLDTVARFSTTAESWMLGGPVLSNYSPVIEIVRIEPRSEIP